MTRSVDQEYLSADARTRLPTPDEALDIAHAFHAAGDEDLIGHPTQQLALDITKDFLSLKPRRNYHAEEAYLKDAIKPIVHSYARALTRRKRQYRKALEDAIRVLEEKENNLKGGRFSMQGIGALWRFVSPLLLPAVFGIFGFLLAKIIGSSDLVSDNLTSTTGTGLPTTAVTLLATYIGRVVSVMINNRARDLLNREFKKRWDEAEKTYAEGKAMELRLARQKLCEAWRQYTGSRYTKRGSYLLVLEGDIALRNNLEQHLLKFDRSLIDQIIDFFREARVALSRLRRRQ